MVARSLDLVRDASLAVQTARIRGRLARACALLTRSNENQTIEKLPYTALALKELQSIRHQDGDDVRAIHHLAIAQHTRAWDLELANDPAAADAWTEALSCWGRLAALASFWHSLEAKLRACDPNADAAIVTELRQNLLENLLEVHVDFIRHYLAADQPDRAERHVRIIKTARIPPVVRKRLAAKVFSVVTAAVPEAKAVRAFDGALTLTERFLALFPDELPALRLHAELAAEWVAGLSCASDWNAITELSRRALPSARRLTAHPELASEPLARAVVVDLAVEMLQRGSDRYWGILSDKKYEELTHAEKQEMRRSLDLALDWGPVAVPLSPAGSRLRKLFAGCLVNRSYELYQEEREVQAAEDTDAPTRFNTGARLCRKSIEILDEALLHVSDDKVALQNRKNAIESLTWYEAQLARLDPPSWLPRTEDAP